MSGSKHVPGGKEKWRSSVIPGRCPCPWQEVGTRWSLRSPPTETLLYSIKYWQRNVHLLLWRHKRTRISVDVGPLKGFRSHFLPMRWIFWFGKQRRSQVCEEELPQSPCSEVWMCSYNCAELFLLQPLASGKEKVKRYQRCLPNICKDK